MLKAFLEQQSAQSLQQVQAWTNNAAFHDAEAARCRREALKHQGTANGATAALAEIARLEKEAAEPKREPATPPAVPAADPEVYAADCLPESPAKAPPAAKP